jgi:hypothetical protein
MEYKRPLIGKSQMISTCTVLIMFGITTNLFSQNVSHRRELAKGNIEIPHDRKLHWSNESLFSDTISSNWANKAIQAESGKVNNPRILLAKLLLKKDIAEVNKYILQAVPWGVTGSVWAGNKNGDYDFSLTVLSTILYFFGDQPDVLYPETTQHLLNVLLTEDGNKFHYKVPNSAGLVYETENHLLMTEGSRYLKNRWKQLHGDTNPLYDNVANGMESKLAALIVQMNNAGLYEFNSLPYTGYTITALLNLEAFASEKIKTDARNLLDYMNWCYALGSYGFKHFAPMRRRYDKAGFQELTTDYHSIFMKVWAGYLPNPPADHNIQGGEVHALLAACMPYRPSDKTMKYLFDNGEGYFVKIGHGKGACPEIYAAGKNYLLSAGGSNRGKSSDIVARPIMLFLNDGATNLSQTFHLSGPGTDFMKWNNTGVYKNFAAAAGPVFIPKGQKPVAEDGAWKIFACIDYVLLAVYSSSDVGLLYISNEKDPAMLLKKIIMLNPDEKKLKSTFHLLEGKTVEYDLLAKKNTWVIKSVDGKHFDRNFDYLPLIAGDIK